MKLSVIIPVYNEEATIERIVKKVIDSPFDKEILIVDDGSEDGTGGILRDKIEGLPGVRIFSHEANRGKGAAIRTAQPHITGEITIIQDADLEYDPADYEKMVDPILTREADVVYGSRFLGMHRAFLFWHMIGNKLLTLMPNVLYNTILTDMETCYKAFRSEVFKRITIRSNRFEFEPEITAKVFKMGCKVFEVPIYYDGREYSQGKKITWKDAFGAIWALIKYRFVD